MTTRGRGARPHLSDDEPVAKMGHPAAMDGAPGGGCFLSTDDLPGVGFVGEVVGEAEGDELGVETAVGEAGPALHFVLGAQAEGVSDAIVGADATGVEVVDEVGLAKGIVEVS